MARRFVVPTKPQIQKSNAHSRVARQPKIALSTKRVLDRRPFPWRPIIRILFFAFITAVIVWLLSSPLFSVKKITVQGLKNVNEQDIIKHMRKSGNIWVYPSREVSKNIASASPLIADVRIYRTLPSTLRVLIAERTLALTWESQGKHYLIGLDGKVIMHTTNQQDLVRVIDTSNIEPKFGSSVATPGFIHFAQELASAFQQSIGAELDHLEIGATTFDVIIVPKSGPKILVESTRSPLAQLSAAKIVIDQFRDDIKQYVDMRVAGKAYYQ